MVARDVAAHGAFRIVVHGFGSVDGEGEAQSGFSMSMSPIGGSSDLR
jgi:hypothetical protein